MTGASAPAWSGVPTEVTLLSAHRKGEVGVYLPWWVSAFQRDDFQVFERYFLGSQSWNKAYLAFWSIYVHFNDSSHDLETHVICLPGESAKSLKISAGSVGTGSPQRLN